MFTQTSSTGAAQHSTSCISLVSISIRWSRYVLNSEMGKRAKKSGLALRLIWQIKSIISRLLNFVSPKTRRLTELLEISEHRQFFFKIIGDKNLTTHNKYYYILLALRKNYIILVLVNRGLTGQYFVP